MSLYSRLDRLAADVEKLNRQVTAVANSPQSQRTSVEGGSIDFNDADGNLMAIMGGQDDGSNTIRHVDGPTPPIPSGLSAHVDGPIVQVSWDGTFEDADTATYDWSHLEVLAVGPNDEQLTGTINDLNGGETSLAATSQGDWFITARSVSRAGKRSLDGDAGTVAVELVGLTGAIDAIQESANGKNTIYYSPTEPVAPEAGFNNGDLWFDTSEEGNNTASVWDGNGWVSMEDARLATIIAAQEALEADLTDVQTSVDGKNTITWDPAAPTLSTPGKAVNDIWYRTSGDSIIGYWKWSGSAWVQQTLSATVIPQIDIGAGTFGTMSGTRLQAGTVSTSMLAVGVGGNLLPDPLFLDPAMSAIRAGTQWTYKTVSGETCFERVMPNPGSTANLPLTDKLGNEYYLPAAPGVKNVLELDVSGPVSVYLYFRMSDGSLWAPGTSIQHDLGSARRIARFVFDPDSYTQNGAVVERFSVRVRQTTSSVTAPPGTVTRVFSARVSPMSGATVIENGAITTDKLAVGSITAESGVIASLDLGTATVGELDGIRIMGQTVRGEQLSGDAIDGKVITGGTYRTSGGNGSWSDAGLFIAQSDGTSMVRFPTDGSPLSLTASDTQIERASIGELDLSYGAVRSGGELTLASGVTAPASPPELTTGWQKVASLQTPDSALTYDWLGLGYWAEGAGHWVRAVNVLGSEGDGYDRIEVYDYATGDFQKSISITLNPRAGVTVIGDVAYVLGPNHEVNSFSPQYVDGYSLVTGEKVSWFGYERFATNAGGRLAIGNDGTNIVVAGITKSNNLYVMRYDPTTGAQVGGEPNPPSDPLGGDWMATGWTGGRDLLGVSISGSEVTIHPLQETRVYTASGSTLTRKLDSANANGFAGWVNPNRNGAGMVFVGGAPYVVDSGVVYEGSTSASDYTSELCFTWYDGTHETTASPVAVVDVAARETVTVSLPARAGLQKRLYSRAQGGTNWARSTVAADTTVAPVPVGIADRKPPTTNSFPNADPATLKSTNDKFEVKGDGSGHWGPLTFNADGSMSGIPKMAAGKGEPVTVTSGGFNTKTVTFPAGRFSTPPTVAVSADTTSEALVNVGALAVTKDGFTLSVRRTNSTPTGVDWIAMEVN